MRGDDAHKFGRGGWESSAAGRLLVGQLLSECVHEIHIDIWFIRALSKRHPRSGFPGVCATWTDVMRVGHDGMARGLGARSNTYKHTGCPSLTVQKR